MQSAFRLHVKIHFCRGFLTSRCDLFILSTSHDLQLVIKIPHNHILKRIKKILSQLSFLNVWGCLINTWGNKLISMIHSVAWISFFISNTFALEQYWWEAIKHTGRGEEKRVPSAQWSKDMSREQGSTAHSSVGFYVRYRCDLFIPGGYSSPNV